MARNVDAHDIYDLWDRFDHAIDAGEYSPAEQRQMHEYLSEIAEDAANGRDIYNSDAFWDYLDLSGLDADNFWDEFRDWYDHL
jgi:hypothetical protein